MARTRKTPTVYYTLDGSAPTTNSTRYTGAFTLTNSATVIALGIRAGYASALVTNNYIYEFAGDGLAAVWNV